MAEAKHWEPGVGCFLIMVIVALVSVAVQALAWLGGMIAVWRWVFQ